MKKIFLLTFLFGLTFSLFAQRGADRIVPFAWTQDNQHLLYTGTALDLVSSTQDSLALDFTLNKTYPVQYDGAVLLDSTSLPRVVVKLQGKTLDLDTWSDITTVIYIGSADTTIKFTLHTEPTYTSTLLFDTTKITTRAERYLYSATGTMTQTSVSKYYYKMRILMIRTRGTANLNKMEWKFWQRLY